MGETWRRFENLSPPSRQLVREAALALLGTWVGLRLVGYARWKRVLIWFMPEAPAHVRLSDGERLGLAQAIARLEESTAQRLPFRSSCLEKSLVLCWLLERRGIEADLRIGGRKEEGIFEAHAWVELHGAVLNDFTGQHRHFTAFEREPIAMNTELS